MTLPKIHAFKDDALGYDDATGVFERLKRREVSAVELVEASFERMAAVEPDLNAVVCENRESAMLAAAAYDKAPSGTGFGCLPAFLKDNLNLKGLPTRHGSRATSAKALAHNSDLAEQMQESGLNFIGKTRLPEFGLTATTEYSRSRATHNPWNTEHSTGGSSGGSGAMVAAGVVPIAHANDGGGSIRIPASCCGLVGLKPTRGRLLPNEMANGLPVAIVSDGVVTRSVRDTARFFSQSEKVYKNSRLPPLGLVASPLNSRKRIAFFTHKPTGGLAHKDCFDAVEKVATWLQSEGHCVEQISPPVGKQFADDFLNYWAMLASSLTYFGKALLGRDFDPSEVEPFTRDLARHCARNLVKLPFSIRRLKAFEIQYEHFFDQYDLILSPTLGTPPPMLGHLALDQPFEQARERLFDFACFTAAQNVSGAPAISLPVGLNEQNLPMSVQFAAPRCGERLLLETAFLMEGANKLLKYQLDNKTVATA